MLYYKMEK